MMTRRNVAATLIPFLSGLIYALVMVMVVIAVLGMFGIPTTSFVAVIGAAGLAIGLAMQGTLSNFAAGVMLLIFRPFRVGDLVQIGGELGVVDEIGIFTTTLNSPSNVRVIMPNSTVFGGVIQNYNGNEQRRVDLVMGVDYGDDVAVAQKVLMDVCKACPQTLDDPAPVVQLHELADSSVNFVVGPWCNAEDYWAVWWYVTENGKKELEAAGCSIPFPQRDVHVIKDLAG